MFQLSFSACIYFYFVISFVPLAWSRLSLFLISHRYFSVFFTFFCPCLSLSFGMYKSSLSLESRFIGESNSCSFSFPHDILLSSSDCFFLELLSFVVVVVWISFGVLFAFYYWLFFDGVVSWYMLFWNEFTCAAWSVIIAV